MCTAGHYHGGNKGVSTAWVKEALSWYFFSPPIFFWRTGRRRKQAHAQGGERM